VDPNIIFGVEEDKQTEEESRELKGRKDNLRSWERYTDLRRISRLGTTCRSMIVYRFKGSL